MQTQRIELNKNTAIPQIGLGTWQLTGQEGQASIEQALQLGYRHIDTAYHYHNHQTVGRAVAQSEVDREDIFITTKIWRDHLTKPKLKKQFDESLEQLDMEYVDLLLVHWPNDEVPIKETLTAMQNLQEAGSVSAIGVSNFTIDLLQEALATGIKPVVNQVEYHPSLVQTDLKTFCDEHDITITAYSPLGHNGRDLDLEPVVEIANEKRVSPATVVVRWLIQQGIVAIPKAASREHQKQNLQASEITLTDEQMAKITDCNQNNRIISPDYGPFAAESKR